MLPYLLYQVGAVGGAAPATVGFSSLLAPWVGGAGSSGTATHPAVGWPARRIKRAELERRLQEQRDNTFGRRRWAELKALATAEEAASRLAIETQSKSQRKALEAATQAARDTARAATEAQAFPAAQIDALTLALQAAASATRIKASLDEARHAVVLANALMAELQRLADQDDEEEAVALLLMN